MHLSKMKNKITPFIINHLTEGATQRMKAAFLNDK